MKYIILDEQNEKDKPIQAQNIIPLDGLKFIKPIKADFKQTELSQKSFNTSNSPNDKSENPSKIHIIMYLTMPISETLLGDYIGEELMTDLTRFLADHGITTHKTINIEMGNINGLAFLRILDNPIILQRIEGVINDLAVGQLFITIELNERRDDLTAISMELPQFVHTHFKEFLRNQHISTEYVEFVRIDGICANGYLKNIKGVIIYSDLVDANNFPVIALHFDPNDFHTDFYYFKDQMTQFMADLSGKCEEDDLQQSFSICCLSPQTARKILNYWDTLRIRVELYTTGKMITPEKLEEILEVGEMEEVMVFTSSDTINKKLQDAHMEPKKYLIKTAKDFQ